MLFNLIHLQIFDEAILERLQKELSENEQTALLALLNTAPIDFFKKSQLKNFDYLKDIAQKYNAHILSSNNQSAVLFPPMSDIEDIMGYLEIRIDSEEEDGVIWDRHIDFALEAISNYVYMLYGKYDVPTLKIGAYEEQMLRAVEETKKEYIVALVASLLCCFSFEEENLPLVVNFLQEKEKIIHKYFQERLWKQKNAGHILHWD